MLRANFPGESLNEKLRASAAKQGIPLIEGSIHSSDVFYRQPSDAKPTYWEKLRDERACPYLRGLMVITQRVSAPW